MRTLYRVEARMGSCVIENAVVRPDWGVIENAVVIPDTVRVCARAPPVGGSALLSPNNCC